jgi:hypothetical protein
MDKVFVMPCNDMWLKLFWDVNFVLICYDFYPFNFMYYSYLKGPVVFYF